MVVKKTLHHSKVETEAGVGNGNPPSHVLSKGGVWGGVPSVSLYERHGVVVKKTLHRSKIEMEAGVGNGNPPSHVSSKGGPRGVLSVSNYGER